MMCLGTFIWTTGVFKVATECGCGPTKGSKSPFATEGVEPCHTSKRTQIRHQRRSLSLNGSVFAVFVKKISAISAISAGL